MKLTKLWIVVMTVLASVGIGAAPAVANPNVSSDYGYTVSVYSTQDWQSVGYAVQGQQVSIVPIGGQWTVDYRNFPYVGAAGYSDDSMIWQGCKTDNRWKYGVLLGQLGDGPVFDVPSAVNFAASRNGVLRFTINDKCFGDNRGSLVVNLNFS